MMPASPNSLWTERWTPAKPNGLTFTDLLCGAGGSSIGMTAAGFTLKLGVNHWQLAIDTHGRNFVEADHECKDINAVSKRALPWTDVLWASIICTEASPAGGKAKKRGAVQPGVVTLDGEEFVVDEAGWEATRATAYDVLAAIEVRKYKAVLIENVLEFVADWPLFRWWLQALEMLGYNVHIVSANSAHIWDENNPPAPQWRDRIYIVCLRNDFEMPYEELEPRPLAYCFDCREQVYARQTWKHTAFTKKHGKIGKYGQQYYYTCPNSARQHSNPVVEPYVLPAVAAIDLSDPGCRIGERRQHKLPLLVANTRRKILVGYDMVCEGPTIVTVNHGDHDGRPFHPWTRPLATRTQKGGGDGVVTHPYLIQIGGNPRDPSSVDQPMPARMKRDTDALVIPPYVVELHGGGSVARPIDHPMGTVTTGGSSGGSHHGVVIPDDTIRWDPDGSARLVIPYRKNGRARGSNAHPLPAISTVDSAGLLQARRNVPIEDFYYRTIRWYENLAAQRFPREYVVLGNGGEKTAQAGNAVSSNVPQWLGRIVARAICR